MIEFNLKKIFADQFGYTPNTDYKVKEEDLRTRRNGSESKYGPYYAKDILGREIFMPLTIGPKKLFLPYTWISVQGSRTIVETPMTERRGTVKEQIRLEDYKFSVKGLFIGHQGDYPEDEIEEWRDLVELNEALEVVSPVTDMFLIISKRGGNDKVVITDWNLTENPGVKHVRGFTMEMVSDQEFKLEL